MRHQKRVEEDFRTIDALCESLLNVQQHI